MRQIGHKLAQVAMVAPAELVLDDDIAKVGFRHQVNAEVAGADLTLRIAQAKPEHFVEFADVRLEPRRKAGILGRPDLADLHGLDESDFHRHVLGRGLRARSHTALYGAPPAIVNTQPPPSDRWSSGNRAGRLKAGVACALRHRPRCGVGAGGTDRVLPASDGGLGGSSGRSPRPMPWSSTGGGSWVGRGRAGGAGECMRGLGGAVHAGTVWGAWPLALAALLTMLSSPYRSVCGWGGAGRSPSSGSARPPAAVLAHVHDGQGCAAGRLREPDLRLASPGAMSRPGEVSEVAGHNLSCRSRAVRGHRGFRAAPPLNRAAIRFSVRSPRSDP